MNQDSEHNHTSIATAVMERIAQEHVPQTGKAYFIARKGAMLIGLALCLAALVFGMSLVLFSLRVTGGWFALKAEGVRFLPSLGLLPLLLAVGLVVVGACAELLLRTFNFGYRKPLLYTGALIAVFTFAVGYGVAKTPLHRAVYDRVQAPGPKGPLWAGLYPAPRPDQDRPYVVGVAHDVSDAGFWLRTRGLDELRVFIVGETELPQGRGIMENDFVLVLGPLREGGIRARSVRLVPDELGRRE